MSIGEDRCTVCGSMRDKNGKYCRDCWKAMGRRYNPHAIGTIGTMDITVAQKRRCISCRILPKCIEFDNIHDGCDTIFKSLQEKKAKEKMRLLARRISG